MRFWVKLISYYTFLCSFCTFFHKLVINRILNECSGTGTTALPLNIVIQYKQFVTMKVQCQTECNLTTHHVIEKSEMSTFYGLINIRVAENYVWRFTTQFQCHSFQITFGCSFGNYLTNLNIELIIC